MEKAILMMDYLNITQSGNGSFSHRGDEAIDIAGKDSNIDNLKAPFTGTIKKIYTNGNAVWLQSNDKVLYADGTVDYMTVLTIHDNDISNLKVGQIIKQGEIYYNEGTKGNATGNHIHIAVGKGKFSGSGWYKNSSGNWCINNQINISKALFILDTCKIINSSNYKFIKTSLNTQKNNSTIYTVVKGDTLSKIAKQFNTTVDNLVKINNITNPNLIYVNQQIKLTNSNYFKKVTLNTTSIVDALKSINEKFDYSYRSKIASLNNITNYTGASNQNIKMLELLKKGLLLKP